MRCSARQGADGGSDPAGDTHRIAHFVNTLYIISYPRSGSTLFGMLLGQHDGCVFVGEVSAVFTSSWDRNCGCTSHPPTHVRDCAFWGPILDKVQTTLDEAGIGNREIGGVSEEWRGKILREAALELRTSGGVPRTAPVRGLVKSVRQLYKHFELKGGNVLIVDSSKGITYAYVLSLIMGGGVRFLHMVRDPRGVVFSSRRKPSDAGSDKPLSTYRAGRVAAGWLARNLAIELFTSATPQQATRLRYEDFCDRPRETVMDILETYGLEPGVGGFVSSDAVVLDPNHAFRANRLRHSEGPLSISADTKWRTGMEATYKAIATSCSAPLRLRYGYRAPRD